MGKTPVPLVIWIDEEWRKWPEVVKLEEKGHQIFSIDDLCSTVDIGVIKPDLIISKQSHWWDKKLWTKKNYLELALKKARAEKKLTMPPKIKKTKKTKKQTSSQLGLSP